MSRFETINSLEIYFVNERLTSGVIASSTGLVQWERRIVHSWLRITSVNAVFETNRVPGYYWIAIAGQEAEEACWDGSDWLVSGSRTRIVGTVLVLTSRTAALPTESLEGQLADSCCR